MVRLMQQRGGQRDRVLARLSSGLPCATSLRAHGKWGRRAVVVRRSLDWHVADVRRRLLHGGNSGAGLPGGKTGSDMWRCMARLLIAILRRAGSNDGQATRMQTAANARVIQDRVIWLSPLGADPTLLSRAATSQPLFDARYEQHSSRVLTWEVLVRFRGGGGHVVRPGPREGAEQGFAASTCVADELEETEIERQVCSSAASLRDAPVRAQL